MLENKKHRVGINCSKIIAGTHNLTGTCQKMIKALLEKRIADRSLIIQLYEQLQRTNLHNYCVIKAVH